MKELLSNNYFAEFVFIIVTCLAFVLSNYIYKKTKLLLLHPVFISLLLVVGFLKITNIEVTVYQDNTKFLGYLLNISVVALGFLLYKHYDIINKLRVPILLSTLLGSLAGVISVASVAVLFGADLNMVATLLPKSITTPLAVGVSAEHNGFVPLTVVVVISNGILGAMIGPWFLDKIKIKSKLGKGLAMGSAAHGIGTAKALEMGALEGAAGGLAISLMGIFTTISVQLVYHIVLIPLFKVIG